MLEELQDIVDEVRGEADEAEVVAMLEAERYSTDPEGVRMQTTYRILESDDVYLFAIDLIAQDQLFDQNINKYGQKLPKYSIHTIKKKARIPGYPPSKLYRYTNYWTGAFYLNGIFLQLNRNTGDYDYKIDRDRTTGRDDNGNIVDLSYFQYIPDDRVGLTEENWEYFFSHVGEMVDREMDAWLVNEMRDRGIDPSKYGYYDF